MAGSELSKDSANILMEAPPEQKYREQQALACSFVLKLISLC